MGIKHRPYIGTATLDRKVVKHTPDALVYLNGDLTIPGCPKCKKSIDVQKYLTQVSVDAGVDPSGASANFTLSIPLHHEQSFARDAKFILRPGLEVHVYMRGYFPVQGLYQGLNERQIPNSNFSETQITSTNSEVFKPNGKPYSQEDMFGSSTARKYQNLGDIPQEYFDAYGSSREEVSRNLDDSVRVMKVFHEYTEQLGSQLPGFQGGVEVQVSPNGGLSPRQDSPINSPHRNGSAMDTIITYETPQGRRRVPATTVWAMGQRLQRSGHIPNGGSGAYLRATPKPGKEGSQDWRDYDIKPDFYDIPHYDHGSPRQWIWLNNGTETRVKVPSGQVEAALPEEMKRLRESLPEPSVARFDEIRTAEEITQVGGGGATSPSLLEQAEAQNSGIENLPAYPYYHVFHGVVTQVDHSYSGGVNNVSIQCASMLHFWQYHRMSTNASIFGARPTNSKLRTSLVGHNFTGMHPYEILYTLHYDMAGAAAGVAWALSQKTSQTAVSPIDGESLFSLNIKYWEKRFNSKMIKLRLHGANGELFSAAQTAFLGRTSSHELTSLVRNRFYRPGSKQWKKNKRLLDQAISVGLFNKNKIGALIQGFARPGRQSAIEINLAEMQAYVANIGNFGQVNLFESTYESKMDIAQRLMEVTGFEFYQDVDGDFVFKPPMYNLDTSKNRIYRLEDIDLISINFFEKEPEATYITGKSSQFKNLQGTGLENEWGVQGQYIDYRMVAKYGWRPQDFETAYFNDPKSVFFAAIDKLDRSNIGSNSASATIPIRPELRPGYPVYVPYLDAFYYCNSISHSYTVGGDCTTSLQLVGKRAKFNAPGKSDGTLNGLDAIDFSKPYLPERPLTVRGRDESLKIQGFPNVVMALDPKQINSFFWIVGTDLERLDNDDVLYNLLQQGVQLKVLEQEGDVYHMRGEDGEVQASFVFDTGSSIGKTEALPINDLAAEFVAQQESQSRNLERIREQVTLLEGDIVAEQSQLQGLDPRANKEVWNEVSARIRELNQQKEALVNQFEQQKRTFQDRLNQNRNLSLLMEVIKRIGAAFREDNPDFADLNSSINLLDILSSKKAIMSNGNQPGEYRYYSASHPNPEMQGQPEITYEKSFGQSLEDTRLKTQEARTSLLVEGLKPSSDPSADAKLGDVEVKRGIKVLKNQPGGEVVPTTEIEEIMFSVQKAKFSREVVITPPSINIGNLGSDTLNRIKDRFLQAHNLIPSPTQLSLEDIFKDTWTELELKIAEGVASVDSDTPIPAFSFNTPFPSKIKIRGVLIETDIELGLLDGNPKQTSLEAAGLLSNQFFKVMSSSRQQWYQSMKRVVRDFEEIESVISQFNSHLSEVLGVLVEAKTRTRKRVTRKTEKTFESPVFPVSDKLGYDVVGTYRYGRGLSIDEDGSMLDLHAVDPLSILDKNTLDQVIEVFVRDGDLVVEEEVRDPDGTVRTDRNGVPLTVKRRLNGALAKTYLEKEVLRQLRTELTNQDLIQLGLAQVAEEPSVVHFNLSNWFSDDAKEGVHKLPVNNQIIQLSGLTPKDLNVCDCKAKEAGVLLKAAQLSEYVEIDGVNEFLKRGVADSAGEYLQQRKVLKGG